MCSVSIYNILSGHFVTEFEVTLAKLLPSAVSIVLP